MRAVIRLSCGLPVRINFVFNPRALTRQNCGLPVGINFVVFNLRAVTKQSCCLPVKINCVLFNLKAVTEQSCSLPVGINFVVFNLKAVTEQSCCLPVWTQLQPPPPFTQRGTCFAGFCHISIKTAISQFLSLHPLHTHRAPACPVSVATCSVSTCGQWMSQVLLPCLFSSTHTQKHSLTQSEPPG